MTQAMRRISLLLVLLMALGLFSGVVGAKTLEMWVIDITPEALNWLENEAIPEFKEKTGHDVIVTVLGWDFYWDKVYTSGAAGVGPDILATDGGMGIDWGRDGWMIPIDQYFDRWEDANTLVPSALVIDLETYTRYAIPFSLDIRGTVYNKRLFSEAGIDTNSPPSGWDQLLDYTRKLTRVVGSELRQIGIFESYDEWWGAQETFVNYLYQTHGNLLSDDFRRVTFHDDKGVATAELITELYAITNPVVESSIVVDPYGGFYDGLVAMTTGGTWVPQVALSVSESWREDLGFFVGSRGPEYEPRSISYANGIGISKFSQDPDLAWEFIAWLTSDEINPVFHKLNGTIGPRMDLIDEYLFNQPELAPWYQATRYAQLYPVIPPHIGAGLDGGALTLGLNNIFLGMVDAKTKLTEIAESWEGVLAQNWARAEGN